MEAKTEMIKVTTWALYLGNEDTGMPVFYYNHEKDCFNRKFSSHCAFLDEKSCIEKQSELKIEGLRWAKGAMDYPKDLMVEIVTDVFTENGLVKKTD